MRIKTIIHIRRKTVEDETITHVRNKQRIINNMSDNEIVIQAVIVLISAAEETVPVQSPASIFLH